MRRQTPGNAPEHDWILVGLGANQGPAVQTLVRSLNLLRARHGQQQWRASSLWRSSPVDCAPGADQFINAVAAFPLAPELRRLGPAGLLAELQQLEQAAGRPRQRARNAPRPLDLDLLLFGEHVQNVRDCIVPHPRALERRFVLEPAAEILPDLSWPGTDLTLVQHAARACQLAPDQQLERLAVGDALG